MDAPQGLTYQTWTARIRAWVQHKKAPRVLFLLSAIESIFFPIPPDTLVIPLSVGGRYPYWYIAGIATLGSLVGAIIGYSIGYWSFQTVGEPLLHDLGLSSAINQVMQHYDIYGGALLLLAGITPIPFKVFTICSGALKMQWVSFVAYTIIGRGIRFFCVAAISAKYGESVLRSLYTRRWIGSLLGGLCILIVLTLWQKGW